MIELVPPIYSELSLDENLLVLVRNGIRVVHLTGVHYPFLSEREVLRIAREYSERGIRIYAGHAPGGNLASLNEAEREKALRRHREALHKLSLMGAEVMVLHGGIVERVEDLHKAKEALLESLRELVELAELEGVRLAIENDAIATTFPRPLLSWRGEVQREIVDEVCSPWLGACLDTGHANVFGNVKKHMEILGRRITAIHMHDNEGRADQHMQPPYGTVDWEGFGEVLRDIGYESPIMIESGPRGDAPIRRMLMECTALLSDLGLISGTPLTLRVSRLVMGWDVDVRVQCPRCGHYILYDGEKCTCACREWPIKGTI